MLVEAAASTDQVSSPVMCVRACSCVFLPLASSTLFLQLCLEIPRVAVFRQSFFELFSCNSDRVGVLALLLTPRVITTSSSCVCVCTYLSISFFFLSLSFSSTVGIVLTSNALIVLRVCVCVCFCLCLSVLHTFRLVFLSLSFFLLLLSCVFLDSKSEGDLSHFSSRIPPRVHNVRKKKKEAHSGWAIVL